MHVCIRRGERVTQGTHILPNPQHPPNLPARTARPARHVGLDVHVVGRVLAEDLTQAGRRAVPRDVTHLRTHKGVDKPEAQSDTISYARLLTRRRPHTHTHKLTKTTKPSSFSTVVRSSRMKTDRPSTSRPDSAWIAASIPSRVSKVASL